MKNLNNYIFEKGEMVLPRPKIEELWDKILDEVDSKDIIKVVSDNLTSIEKNKIIMQLNDEYDLKLI